MKQLTEYIFKQIITNVKSGSDKQVIRVDGFDDLELYLYLCQKAQAFCLDHEITLIAKLAQAKYEQLAPGSSYAASQMKSNGWVDFEDHMTSYRNLVPEEGQKLFVLMLGTDMVADKGGLNDFFSITPNTVDRSIGKRYSLLMSDELRDVFDDFQIDTVIDTFFGELFSSVPQNLSKVSKIMDGWLNTQLTVQDVIQELYRKLPEWQIPMIIDAAEHLTPAKMQKQTKRTSLIKSAFDFIQGKAYSRVTKATITNTEKKFDAYKENQKKFAYMYPDGQEIETYDELKKVVMAFIAGNHSAPIRHKLLHTDFSIIDDIVKFKLNKGPGPEPEKEIKVYGSPLEAMCSALLGFMCSQDETVDQVRFNFSVARMCGMPSGVSDKEELEKQVLEKWSKITCFAGGIIDFIAQENWLTKNGTALRISSTPEGFFSPRSAESLYKNGHVIKGTGGKHKVSFKLEALCGDEEVAHSDYCWYIDPFEDWQIAFVDLFAMPEEETSYIPFAIIDEMNAAFTLKDEEGFAYWYDHHDRRFLTSSEGIISRLNTQAVSLSHGEQKEIGEFYNLGKKFVSFRQAVLNNGFYSTITRQTAELIDAYINLAERVAFTSIYTTQAQMLSILFMNAFNICANTNPLYTTGNAKQFITPPYHPAMLEKLADKMIFIRTGLKEWAEKSQYSKMPGPRIDELVSLSAVHNAADAYYKTASELQPYSESFGYYTLYGSVVEKGGFVSALDIQRQETVFDDDFDESEMKRLTRESEVLLHVLKEYTDTYPQGKETFSIVFINPSDLQQVVSSLYQYVVDFRKNVTEQTPASIQLTVINRNELHSARTYLSYWINHVFTADDNLDIKVYLRVYRDEMEIPRLIPSSADLAFFFDALDTDRQAAYNFVRINVDQDQMNQCRFPMVFKPTISIKGATQRTIDITQPQFHAATAHSQVLRLYRDRQIYDFHSGLVQVSNLNPERGKVIKRIQDKVIWLACIDSAMDKNTVRHLYAEDTGIIGFTTGEGSFGQMNMALTCRKTIADDIMKRCASRIHRMFPKWSDVEIGKAAAYCMKKARDMDGVSILRAMNPSDYDINNFLAYLITDELTRKSNKKLNILVRLDSYRHWFRDAKAGETKIPDFLLLQADVVPGEKLHLAATVIEAKIARYATMYSEHLPKAQEQVRQGLSVLKDHFGPMDASVEHRYWLAQLYRAIVFLQSDLEIKETDFEELTNQLNAMVEGSYEIKWHRRIMACVIDSNTLISDSTINLEFGEIGLTEIGQLAIKNILLNQSIGTPVDFDPDATEEDISRFAVSDDEDEEADFEAEEEIEKPQEKKPKATESSSSAQDNSAEPQKSEEENPVEPEEQRESETPERSETPEEDKTDAEVVGEKAGSQTETEAQKLSDIRVLIGQDRMNRSVYWEFGHPQLANRHLLITGGSGQGKTYAIQTFLYELAKQKISSVVFDYTDGFLPGKLEPQFAVELGTRIDQRVAIIHRIPINPFKRQMIDIPGFSLKALEKSSNAASRFAAIMKHVYKFGEQQYSTLYTACREGIDTWGEKMNFDHLIDTLTENGTTYAKSVLNKITPLVDQELFDTENAFDWSSITEREGKVTVIQLTQLDRETQTVITEMLMWDAWYSLQKTGNKDHPFVVVLDEAQNLSFADGSPAQKILQEGRKFGWSAWFATQFLKGALSTDEISRLQQAAETLYFKPSNEEVSSVAQMLANSSTSASDWVEIIKRMQKGNCIVQGDRIRANNEFGSAPAVLVRVSSFEDRSKLS